MAEPLNTGLSAQQVLTAFNRALNDYTDTEIDTLLSAKQDALTFDSAPTEDSTNPVTSGGVWTDQQRQETEIGVVAAMGAKNLFPITAISQTVGGVTFTVNGDGTITANGTKTNNDWFILSENNSFDANTYTLSDGLPNDTTDFQLIIATARSMSAAIMATSVNSRPQTKTFTTAQTGLYYAIRIASGKTVNNLTFKPMIRRAEISDSTYAPYAPTNRELYETAQPAYDFIFGLGTALQSNDDLNNYNRAGKIYAATGAIAATISNTPWTLSGFMVITIPMLTAAAFIQFLLPNTSGGKWYKRRYTTGAWSAWTEYDGTQVAASQSASPASLMQAGRLDAELTDAQEVTDAENDNAETSKEEER